MVTTTEPPPSPPPPPAEVVLQPEPISVVPNSAAKNKSQKPPASTSSVSMYTVQCGKCFKFRLIPTLEEFEEIRKSFIEDPWVCNKKPNVTCEDPTDIEYDNSRTWLADKPNLPKTPDGFKRSLVIRRDFSKCDAYYHLPTGKKVKSPSEIEQFLDANPEYKSRVKLSDFTFTSPKVMPDTLPPDWEVKTPSKKSKK